MSSPDVSIAPEILSNRMNLVNFETHFNLTNGIYSANKDKMDKIFTTLSQKNISDNKKEILKELIDACKCKEYTYTRILGIFERKVKKTTHVS